MTRRTGNILGRLTWLTDKIDDSLFGRVAGNIGNQFRQTMPRLSIMNVLGRAARGVTGWFGKHLNDIAAATLKIEDRSIRLATGLTLFVGQVLLGCTLEAISELGFDALDSMNEGERPAFGNKVAFFGVFVGMTVVSTAMQARHLAAVGKSPVNIDTAMGSLFGRPLVEVSMSSSILLRYSAQCGRLMQSLMWLTVSPTLMSYSGL
jgi:hypothetical protein